MNEKSIWLIILAGFLALMISFTLSPPASPPRPCLDATELAIMERKVNSLKETLKECKAFTSAEKLNQLQQQVLNCQKDVSKHRELLNELQEQGKVICD